jgi:hypothetical protein
MCSADEDVSPSQTPGHTSNGQQAVPAEQPQEDGGKPSADAMDREVGETTNGNGGFDRQDIRRLEELLATDCTSQCQVSIHIVT